MRRDKATGPDRILNWILSDLAGLLAPPICAVYNSSLREGYFPPIPLPKVKPPTRIHKDLRPIPLTLEKHICSWIMDIGGELSDPQQYGSIKGSSTVHALVELVHKWQQALESPGRMVRVLLLDFSKAFDRVDHTILMNKLASILSYLIFFFKYVE